jgi:2-dehydropantoate 2-reductase
VFQEERKAVAVLGAGAVGGTLAVRLDHAGVRVVCVGTESGVAALRSDGLTLAAPHGTFAARPEATELLSEPVPLLLVTVKATGLAEALERVEAFAVADGVAVSLLNGLEHPETIRRRLGPRVAAGSVSHFEAYRDGPAHIVQTTPGAVITIASEDIARDELERSVSPLRHAAEVVVADDERKVLWEKAARLGPLAVATAVTQLPVGALRADEKWRATSPRRTGSPSPPRTSGR